MKKIILASMSPRRRELMELLGLPFEVMVSGADETASTTSGNAYRATNNSELKQIYKDIDVLEKTKMDVKRFSKRYEAYQPFALAAFVLLLIEILLRLTVLRRIP